MNVNHMRMLTHVEFESKTYYTAFSIEFESVAAVMWEVYRSIVKMVIFKSLNSSIVNSLLGLFGR